MARSLALLPTLAAGLVAAAAHSGAASAQASAPAPARQAAPPAVSTEGRPVVLLVHGRGMQARDTAGLRRAWGVALEDAIRDVGGLGLLGREDVRLVWYADAVEEAGASSCAEDEGARPSREAGWARDVGSTLEAVGTFMGLAADLMGGAEGEALDALAGDLVYLGDDRRRCGAGARLAEALESARREGRPVLLVTHSFGALVAYDHFRTRASGAPRVERWVTVGSLLGHPELRELLLARGGGSGLPDGVGSWVNVRDPADPLAAPLVGLRGRDDPPDAIQDRVTESRPTGDRHEMARYLADPATARSVLEGWCDAADPRTRASSPCGAVGAAGREPPAPPQSDGGG